MTCRCSRQVYNRSSAYRQHVSATDVGMPNSLEHMAHPYCTDMSFTHKFTPQRRAARGNLYLLTPHAILTPPRPAKASSHQLHPASRHNLSQEKGLRVE